MRAVLTVSEGQDRSRGGLKEVTRALLGGRRRAEEAHGARRSEGERTVSTVLYCTVYRRRGDQQGRVTEEEERARGRRGGRRGGGGGRMGVEWMPPSGRIVGEVVVYREVCSIELSPTLLPFVSFSFPLSVSAGCPNHVTPVTGSGLTIRGSAAITYTR